VLLFHSPGERLTLIPTTFIPLRTPKAPLARVAPTNDSNLRLISICQARGVTCLDRGEAKFLLSAGDSVSSNSPHCDFSIKLFSGSSCHTFDVVLTQGIYTEWLLT